MKRTIYTTLCILLLSSCSDWLEVEPRDSMRETTQYATESAVNSALNGLYRTMIAKELYGGNLSQTFIERLAHVYYIAPDTQAGETVFYTNTSYFNYDNSDVKGTIQVIWNNAYTLVFRINNFIESLSKSTLAIDAQRRNTLLGEAYGLRAYVLFDLFRLFGPIYDETTREAIAIPYANQAAAIAYPNDTASVFIDKLLADIAAASDLMQQDPILTQEEGVSITLERDFYGNRNRRMNYYAVQALKARILLYAGKEAEAAQAAQTVIDAAKFNWASLTNVLGYQDHVRFSEVIFGIDNQEMYSNANKWYLESTRYTGYYIDDVHLNFIHSIEETWVNEDYRTQQWAPANASAGNDNTISGLWIARRYKDRSETLTAVPFLQPLIRIGEMVCIVSEAGAKHPELGIDAVDLLQQMLQARSVSEPHRALLTGADQAKIMSFLDREYYRELLGEGQVFFYNKRRKKTSIITTNGGSMQTIDRTPEEIYVLPLPDSETNI